MKIDQIVIYKPDDNHSLINVQIKDDTVWLNQRQMAELFEKDADTVGLHIRNIYKEGD